MSFLISVLFILISCNTDDKNNSNHDEIESLITVNNFIISNYNDSGEDKTYEFACYQFSFTEDGSVDVQFHDDSFSGTWNLIEDDNADKLVLNFGNELQLSELNDDWEILNYSSDQIELEDVSGGDGSIDSLVFTIGTTSEECNHTLISDWSANIVQGSWYVSSFIEDEVDETYHYSGYSFNFMTDNSLIVTDGTMDYSGSWSFYMSPDDDETKIELVLMFNENSVLQDLSDDWTVVDYQNNSTISLKDISGGDGSIDYLTFSQ